MVHGVVENRDGKREAKSIRRGNQPKRWALDPRGRSRCGLAPELWRFHVFISPTTISFGHHLLSTLSFTTARLGLVS